MKILLSVGSVKMCFFALLLCLCTLTYVKYQFAPAHMVKDFVKTENIPNKIVSQIKKEVIDQREAPEQSNETSCTPVRSIVFLKTHKTGSTSVKTVLEKHRDKYLQIDNVGRNFREVRCSPCPYYGGYPGRFKARFANIKSSPLVKLRGDDEGVRKKVLLGHMRFDKDELRSLMSSDAKYVTILRNPLKQFQSTFQYFYGHYKHSVPGQIEIACRNEPFLQVTGRFGVKISEYLTLADRTLSDNMTWFFRSKNYQSYDLGLDPKNMDSTYIMQKAKELDSSFDLVMITDYFLESLILMKDVLCISWSEMVGKYRNKQGYLTHRYTTEEIDIMNRLFKQDFMLYDYFNKTFWRKVDEYGSERMQRDKQYLMNLMADSKRKQARKKTRKKRDAPIYSELSKKSYVAPRSRREHIDLLVNRIVNRTKTFQTDLEPTAVREMANYMFDNFGSCPR